MAGEGHGLLYTVSPKGGAAALSPAVLGPFITLNLGDHRASLLSGWGQYLGLSRTLLAYLRSSFLMKGRLVFPLVPQSALDRA